MEKPYGDESMKESYETISTTNYIVRSDYLTVPKLATNITIQKVSANPCENCASKNNTNGFCHCILGNPTIF